jgi:galactosamine-6-phosphate isomerase
MEITYCIDYREMSKTAADLVMDQIIKKPDLLLCAATGNSPEGLYRKLAAIAGRERQLFRQLRIIKLDEWGGVPENHPVTCEYFLRNRLLDPLGISPEHYISFASDPENAEEECERISTRLQHEGPIDICILGLGRNGHLALNEPAAGLEPFCHVADLTVESLQHPMIAALEKKPGYGLTLGMQEILRSRKIIMLVAGKEKKQVAEKFLESKVTTTLPASFLWLHPHVECLVDQEIMQ